MFRSIGRGPEAAVGRGAVFARLAGWERIGSGGVISGWLGALGGFEGVPEDRVGGVEVHHGHRVLRLARGVVIGGDQLVAVVAVQEGMSRIQLIF
jgi:hypothetical protein